jgi:hypothetical protein
MDLLDKEIGQPFSSHVLGNPKEASSNNDSFIFRINDYLQSERKIKLLAVCLRFCWRLIDALQSG